MRPTLTFFLSFMIAGFLSAQSLTVPTFQNEVHLGGAGSATGTFHFPDDVSSYNQVLMHIDLNCAPGVGCDPYDRLSRIFARKDGSEWEIGRYVTPFGIGSCGWTIDVSAYREILSGEVELHSTIETYSNGWSLNLDFEFIEGEQDFQYITVSNLWHGWDDGLQRSYGNFKIGDTLWFKDNLPERETLIPANAEKIMIRVYNTGHGQGNTNNAAEFYEVTHALRVNGEQAFEHHLWKDDCGQNPCSPQNGTWLYPRAGWCPGQDVKPADFDVSSRITPGQPARFDYVLQPYLNRCSPLYPNCSPASDCAFGNQVSCNFDGNLHTEPRYVMAIQLIVMSNTPLTSVEEPDVERQISLYPNPSSGTFRLGLEGPVSGNATLSVYNINGRQVYAEQMKGHGLNGHDLELGHLPEGAYFLELDAESGRLYQKLLIQR
ncbi:MAG: T9SS type A sorting domain-containing protein [Lewinellaceae bacterium]|nr:T9SS type A sorting domain-containing protein [Phaeodactylibacter sp.]MCB9037875.1 T9SS type A sorting domain-containing protein [Lewinellaceae bacterium]